MNVNAQVIDSSTCIYYYPVASHTFCDTSISTFNVVIDTQINNLWQVGKTNKFGNSNPRDTSCAIITDTLNTYATNNYSTFHFVLPDTSGFAHFAYYIKFWHKFETDSLLDGCWLEFSVDSGNTWMSFDSARGQSNNAPNIYNFCNLYSASTGANNSMDTLLNGQKAWSGSSNGWIYTALLLNVSLPYKKSRSNFINAIRFVFQSDSIQTNKAGWILDEVTVGKGYITIWNNVDEVIIYNKLPIFPNPSSDGIFQISYPQKYVKGTIQVFDMNGEKVLENPLNNIIDLHSFSNGLYYYKIYFDNKMYTGVLNKN